VSGFSVLGRRLPLTAAFRLGVPGTDIGGELVADPVPAAAHRITDVHQASAIAAQRDDLGDRCLLIGIPGSARAHGHDH
jgi:hypothetical protein